MIANVVKTDGVVRNDGEQVPPLSGLSSLARLGMEQNRVTHITNVDFAIGGVPVLSDIKLGGNQITTVARDAFKQLGELGKYYGRLCLENNPLDCCGLEWLRAMPSLDALCDGVATCQFPARYKNRPLKQTRGTICL